MTFAAPESQSLRERRRQRWREAAQPCAAGGEALSACEGTRETTRRLDMAHPDPSDFTTNIDNPYFILRPGTTFVYENKDENSVDTMTVTRRTVVIDGVTCVVVHDTETANGLLIEDTFDWFAQDSAGNVWYFGEDTHEFEPGNPVPISDEGSWEAGVDGAEAGIIMKADPQVGDRYQQEFAPGIAEDYAKVLSLDAAVSSPYGSSDEALKTKDVNPLDPSVEHKYYIPGVGNVLTTDEEGSRQELVKIIVRGLACDDDLLGYAGGDEIIGRDGDDVLRGLAGNDTMRGGTGDDSLRGGEGGDDLYGGSGDDRFTGGQGSDSFVIHGLHNGMIENDTIADYRKGQLDVIDLPGGAERILEEELVGDVWELTLKGDGDIVRLLDVVDKNGDGRISDDLLIA
jgi:Ca2+-binding RTX toxin-like protein